MRKRWKKESGPRPFSAEDIAAGWTYRLRRDATVRDVHVELTHTAALAAHLPEDCRRAIRSNGWSAVVPYLVNDEPPLRIVISTAGIVVSDYGLLADSDGDDSGQRLGLPALGFSRPMSVTIYGDREGGVF